MKVARFIFLTIAVALACSAAPAAFSQERDQKEPDWYKIAEEEADRLQNLLDLEDWQVFYVDSTLKHDVVAMRAEIENLSKSRVSNGAMYQAVQDKWAEATDASYRRIFNDAQWALYLKNGAARMQKAREKRREKVEAATLKKKK